MPLKSKARHTTSPAVAAGGAPTRPIEEWMEAKTGKRARDIRIKDVLALPRRRGLKYAPITSKLGGQLDRHLKHLSDEETDELLKRGDGFLEDTPADPC